MNGVAGVGAGVVMIFVAGLIGFKVGHDDTRTVVHTVTHTQYVHEKPHAIFYKIDLTCPNGVKRHLVISPTSPTHGKLDCERHRQ